MSKDKYLISEDDVRSKIVYTWFKNCGLSDKDILIEYSITIRLGHGVKSIPSRSDILIKHSDGRNLLIVEIKKYDHVLIEQDKLQGISYARALAEGGIAPFTVITNGKVTNIYDSVTGSLISGESVPPSHIFIANGFRVSGDLLTARSEALLYLITLSKENLLLFCKEQVEFHMSLLKSNDPFSSKKYIPQLYVERQDARKELNLKLFGPESKDVLLIAGPPQTGKTCFVCKTVEELLAQEIPCLFYPAINLRQGLFYEIQEDFHWNFYEKTNSFEIIRRLVSLVAALGRALVIVIDGWNEMEDCALLLNNELQRLGKSSIKIILSTTSPSLNRLLLDNADNLTHIGTAINLNPALIHKLVLEPLQNTERLGLVQIGRYSRLELAEAKTLHELVFDTKFSDAESTPEDPFFLRIASELYSGEKVPLFLNRTNLLQSIILRKAARRNLSQIEIFRGLKELADALLEYDAPFCIDMLPSGGSIENFFGSWTECGILLIISDVTIPLIDFYYTYDKNFAIAIAGRRWQEKLLTNNLDVVKTEVDLAMKTTSGRTALAWFLSCPEYVDAFRIIFSENNFISNLSSGLLKPFVDAIYSQVNFNHNLSFDWLDQYIEQIQISQVNLDEHLDEVCTLIYALLKSIDRYAEKGKYELWMRTLLKMDYTVDHVGIQESFVHQYYGEEIRTHDGFETFIDGDFDIDLFERFLLDSDLYIAIKASEFLAFVCPDRYMERLMKVIATIREKRPGEEVKLIVSPACSYIVGQYHERYFGGWCRGWFSDAEPGDEQVQEEYLKQVRSWIPILNTGVVSTQVYAEINQLLCNLKQIIKSDFSDEVLPPLLFTDPNQLTLDFGES